VLIDAHAHLDKYAEDEIDGVVASMDQRRLATISVAVDPESYLRAAAIAEHSDLIVATFGIHPSEAPAWVDRLDEVEPLVEQSPMIGEVGLDHRFVEDPAQYDAQRTVFEHFLAGAVAQDKVVNVHCAGAEAETLTMLRQQGCRRAIVHWYSGPIDVLSEMITEGYMFTVGVEVLTSDHIRQVASSIPDDQLLTETDNPGGHRWLTGNVGMPQHLEPVVEELARIRQSTSEDLEQTVHANMVGLLGGDQHMARWLAELEN
jgi:TatD DNase family protein